MSVLLRFSRRPAFGFDEIGSHLESTMSSGDRTKRKAVLFPLSSALISLTARSIASLLSTPHWAMFPSGYVRLKSPAIFTYSTAAGQAERLFVSVYWIPKKAYLFLQQNTKLARSVCYRRQGPSTCLRKVFGFQELLESCNEHRR